MQGMSHIGRDHKRIVYGPVELFDFVNHSDMAGGSTLGNILLTQMEMRGVDIGNPMWAMHSVRETAGVLDQDYVIKAFTTFYNI